MFPCGHSLCCRCCDDMERRAYTASRLALKRTRNHPGHIERSIELKCPICRQLSPVEALAPVRSDVGSELTAGGTDQRPGELRQKSPEFEKEQDIVVCGSLGSKVCYGQPKVSPQTGLSFSVVVVPDHLAFMIVLQMQTVIRRIMCILAQFPSDRIVVFSTWRDVLAILEHGLLINNVDCLRPLLLANSDGPWRDFKLPHENPTVDGLHETIPGSRVLLLPVKEAGKGLNLLGVNHVFFMEPLINPAVEAQAIGRIYRLVYMLSLSSTAVIL